MAARLQRIMGHFDGHAVLDNSLQNCSSSEQLVKVEKKGRVAIVTLDRQKALNALCGPLTAQLEAALQDLERGEEVGCIILTGAGRAFAAGADISEFKGRSLKDMAHLDLFKSWQSVSKCKVPIIAAVNGFALGGGCEIAMMCDIMIASEKAKFGQPEITLGLIAGAGGSQRLTKAVGKSLSMEMNLTGRMLTAQEALQFGLVSAVVPHDDLLPTAMKMAEKIASMSLPVAKLAKEAVNASYEATLREGLETERRLFHSCFSLEDKKEGVNAFLTKSKPSWSHK